MRDRCAVMAVLLMVAAACSTDSGDGGDGDGGGANSEDTGTVNVLNAMEPNEAEALQAVIDENIGDVDYAVEVEASGRLRGAVPDPRRGRHPRRRGGPPAGPVPALVDAGTIVSLEDMGFDIDELRGVRRVPPVARRIQRRALRPPDEHQPEEHGLVPEGRLRRGGLHGARRRGTSCSRCRDQIVADGSTPWCVGLRVRRRHRVAGHRLDGRHHAPDGRSGRLRPVGDARDPVQRPGRGEARPRRSATSCSTTATSWAAPTPRRTSRSATRRCRCSRTRRGAGCTGRRASSQRLLPRGRGGGRGLRLVPVPPDRSGGDAVRR